MKLPGYHQDLHTLHVNTLPNRAYYVPYSQSDVARRDIRTESDRFTSLNGRWRFRYFDSVLDLPDDYLSEAQPISTEGNRVGSQKNTWTLSLNTLLSP